jgi:hypothetical protein
MGTRSVTFVEDDGERYVAMYRQMDGDPTGMGADIKKFLTGFSLCNGISFGNDTSKQFNGLGCLAASLVAEFKDGIGGIYLYPTNTDTEWIDYTYTIYADRIGGTFADGYGDIKLKVIKVGYDGERPDKVIFDGVVDDFDPERIEAEEREAYELENA